MRTAEGIQTVADAAQMILDHAAEAPEQDVPGLVAALECVLSHDERPAHELVEEARTELLEIRLADAARGYLRDRLEAAIGRLEPAQLRAVVALLYPPATPGQDGWTSFLTDYPPATALREGDGR